MASATNASEKDLHTEQTGPQVLYVSAGGDQVQPLRLRLPATYRTYREIAHHPTVALASAISVAAVCAADWSIEAKDDATSDMVKLIQDAVFPRKNVLLEQCMLASMKYGWIGYEIVLANIIDAGVAKAVPAKIKALLHEKTSILTDKDSGEIAGLRQKSALGTDIDVMRPKAMVINFRVEGDEHYGEPLLENCRLAYADWQDANEGAQRFDRKIAGDHWVVGYPPGQTEFDGVKTPNHIIAKRILDTLESSGQVAIPGDVINTVNQVASISGGKWTIQLLSAGGQQGSFLVRQEYCDKRMVRGMCYPERSILEGNYGTKADAGEHGDFALTVRELEHDSILRQLNPQLCDLLLAINYGPEAIGKVWIEASPLVDEKRAFVRSIFTALLNNPATLGQVLESLDIDALVDSVGLPKSQEVLGDPDSVTSAQRAIVEQIVELKRKIDGQEIGASLR